MASIDKLKYNFDTGARANMFSAFINCPKLGFKLEGLRVETCSFGGEGDVDTGNSIHPIFKYYYDYVGTLTINALRKDDKTSLEYTIHEAYPVSFEKMEFSSESGDILKFSVTFNFRTWESKYVPAPKLSALNKGRRVLDALQDGLKVGSRFNRKSKDFLDKVNKLDGTATRLQTLLGGNG